MIVKPTRKVITGATAIAVLGFLGFVPMSFCQKDFSNPIELKGTVTDADGSPISFGSVGVSFAGGPLGDFEEQFKSGEFHLKIDFPEKKPLPLMIKLTFYIDKFPPRYIEHLSPRIPKNRMHDLHVVVYTDEQLKKANINILSSELQQIEAAMVTWCQGDNEFKKKNENYYLYRSLDRRRKLAYTHWHQASLKSDIPERFRRYMESNYSDASNLSRDMAQLLPDK